VLDASLTHQSERLHEDHYVTTQGFRTSAVSQGPFIHQQIGTCMHSWCVTKRCKGVTKEGGGKEAGNREAHAGNRANPAAQADSEHSRGSKSHTGAQTNRNREKEQPHTALLV
jgi:hypothetical protein